MPSSSATIRKKPAYSKTFPRALCLGLELPEREATARSWDHPPALRATTRKKKNNIHSNQLNAYFHQLEKKLMDKEELLLMGPGVTKTHFFHHLRENKHFSKLKIEVIDADKMSEKQLLAKVKQKFSPSS